MRGVKKLVNTSDVLCINGMDVVKLVNNSFELVRNGLRLGNVCRADAARRANLDPHGVREGATP